MTGTKRRVAVSDGARISSPPSNAPPWSPPTSPRWVPPTPCCTSSTPRPFDILRALARGNATAAEGLLSQLKTPAGVLLDRWTATVIACGWSDLDVYGCDPDRPDARFDCMGVVLLLNRCRIVAVYEAGADLVTNGATQCFRRRPLPPGTISLWELAR